MMEYSKYTWADGDTEETWRDVTDPCTVCGDISEPTTIQSTFMPGNRFLVVSLQLCSACREELWRVADEWSEVDLYAEACLEWLADGYNETPSYPTPEVYKVVKKHAGLKVQESIKNLRKRILDWVLEQRVEIE